MVVHAVGGLVREAGQDEHVARIVAVNHVDRQFELDDRMQSGRGDQVPAVQYCLGAQCFCLGDGGSQPFPMVVAVGDNADFHVVFLSVLPCMV